MIDFFKLSKEEQKLIFLVIDGLKFRKMFGRNDGI